MSSRKRRQCRWPKCGVPCYGRFCEQHYKKGRKQEAEQRKRRCSCESQLCEHEGRCKQRLSRRNRSGCCQDCLRATGAMKVDGKLPPPEPQLPPVETFSTTQDGDTIQITSRDPMINTIEEAISASGADMKVWRIDKQRFNAYQSPNKDGTRQLHAISLTLKRIIPEAIELATEVFVNERVKPHARNRSAAVTPKLSIDTIAEFSPYDHHFGKLAWGREVDGFDYDLQVARERYLEATEEAVSKVQHWKIGRWVMPVGNDFFHFDGHKNETTAGTVMDVDGRWAKVYGVGVQTLIDAVGMMAKIAPVRIYWVPGNHDTVSSYWLIMVIRAHFANDIRVQIDVSPTARKYEEFGKTIIGYTHGNNEPMAELPMILVNENLKSMSNITYREWHIGHWHHRKKMKWVDMNETQGCVIRVMPSLSGMDYWHYSKGFGVGVNRCAEVLLYDHNQGPIAQLTVGAEKP